MTGGILEDGLSFIPKRMKPLLVGIMFILMVINHNLPTIHEVLDYPYRMYGTIFFLLMFIVVSLGSEIAESIVIGISLFSIMSAIYDWSVLDISDIRLYIIFGGITTIILASIFGKISIVKLGKILKNQLGL